MDDIGHLAWRQAIIWTKDGLVYWCIYVTQPWWVNARLVTTYSGDPL